MSFSNLKMFVFSSLLLAGCSSHQTSQNEKVGQQSAPVVKRKYIVRDLSHTETPLWTYDLMAYNEKIQGDNKFFVGESGDVNDKLAGCDFAKARAKQELSEEIVTFVKSNMSATPEGQLAVNKMSSDNSVLAKNFKLIVTQESVAMLAGVRIVSTSWEERDYSETGGASSVFNCKALIAMKKNIFDGIVNRATKKVTEDL